MPDLLTGHDAPISVRDMADECRREVAFRRRVYARWVEQKRMSQGEADRRIAVMEAAADFLTTHASAGGR
jgi:aminoglycoside phosphotransferase (APT) family kinase protein